MIIGTIVDGLVIDHIPAGRAMELYHYLGLDRLQCEVAIIKNASSEKLGRKDIIKIDAKIHVNFDVVGFVDPGATVNIIRDGVLKEKKQMGLPERLTNVIRCKNPRCITSTERAIDHVFRLTDRKNKIYRCIYCETKA